MVIESLVTLAGAETTAALALPLKGECNTDFSGISWVDWLLGCSFRRQLDGVELQTAGKFDAWAESLGVAECDETGIVDLCLCEGITLSIVSACNRSPLQLTNECSGIEVGLSTNFESDVTGVLRRVGSDGTGFSVAVDTVIVASLVSRQRAESLEHDRVFWGRVSDSTRV